MNRDLQQSELIERIREGLRISGELGEVWEYDSRLQSVVNKNGHNKICDIRSWGYLTGSSPTGALGLNHDAAEAIQDGTGEFIASLRLIAELALSQHEQIEQLKAELAAERQGANTLDEEGMDANDKLSKLAMLILYCDLATPKGLRAKHYAQYCLGQRNRDPEIAKDA